jgi:hypothetical protein
MDFSFVVLMALSAVIDLHIKLRRTVMIVEGHEETLMEVMILCKLRPATLEVHLPISIVPDLHFVGSSSSRVFTKNCFSQLPSIHKLGELQRYPLNLAALGVGDAKEGVHFGRRRRRSIMRWGAQTWRSRRNLGLIFTSRRAARAPLRRSGRRGYRSRACGLFFTAARAAATSLFHWSADVQTRSTCISHEDKILGGKTLDKMGKRKMMLRRKIVMKELGVFPKPTRFIYKQTLMGLCKLKVQVHLRAFIFSPEQKIKTAERATTRRRKIQYE